MPPSPPSPALRDRVEQLYAWAMRGQWPDVWLALAGERELAAACVVHASVPSGWTFLHQAAHAGDEPGARTLVRLGASVAALSQAGETAQHVAVERGHFALAEVLAAAERGTGMLWEAPSRPDALPSSCAWDEAQERSAWRELRIAYGGSVVVIPEGARYYVDAFERALIGWHGTYDPPSGMDGEPLF
jgi:uncharacterized protein